MTWAELVTAPAAVTSAEEQNSWEAEIPDIFSVKFQGNKILINEFFKVMVWGFF